jgi:D-3-phosphoglycerate dehydrogenase
MSTMRLSRWGKSPYETDTDIQQECEALSGLVDVTPEGADADIVVVHSKIPFGAVEHKRAPSVQLLLTTTSGTDHIDLEYLSGVGVRVARLPEARCHAVVDATLGMLIWGLRRMGPMQARARSGSWVRKELPTLAPVGLKGSRVGVVGLGVIGRRVADVLNAFGVEVWGADPAGVPEGVRDASVAEMLGHCDGVTLHCDLNPTSGGLISGNLLAGAHPDLVLVNTARGAIMDVSMAVEMLHGNLLGALAVDVFPQEPWPHMDWVENHPSLMFLPHAAGYHVGLARAIREGLCRAVSAYSSGSSIPHLVGPR